MVFWEKSIYNERKFGINDLINHIERLMQVREFERKMDYLKGVPSRYSNYAWLSTKRKPRLMLTTNEIFEIKKLATNLTSEDCSTVATQLNNTLINDANIIEQQIPDLAKQFLRDKQNNMLLKSVPHAKLSFLQKYRSFRVAPFVFFNQRTAIDLKPRCTIFTVKMQD